jgi:hypothetical protein
MDMIVHGEVGATTAAGVEDAARTCERTREVGGRIRPALNHAAAVRDRGGGGDVEGFQELVANAKEGLAWGEFRCRSGQVAAWQGQLKKNAKSVVWLNEHDL